MSRKRSINNRPPKEARHLWEQMLERARKNEWSTFDDPEYEDSQENKERAKKAFLDAGWTDKEIASRQDVSRIQELNAPTTSDGVARFSEVALERLSSSIIIAATELNLCDVEQVHFVVEPKAGPFVSTLNVMMTDQSIIAMGSFFTRYCGLVSRAYVRTVNLFPAGTGLDFDEQTLRCRLRQNPDLLFYWWRIFVSFALTGTHILAPFRPSTREEILLVEQMAYAMEIFALSHEYGHHCLKHAKAVADAATAKEQEFEADRFAHDICEHIEVNERYKWIPDREIPNPYLASGSAGILLLGSLEIFRKVKDKIFHNEPYDTHPEFSERSKRIKACFVLQPQKYLFALDFCTSVENVLKCVLVELEPMMKTYSYENMAKMIPGDWEELSQK